MSSLIAVPLQILCVTCELLFILDNKLRIQKEDFNVPAPKCDSIMEDVLEKVLAEMRVDEMFSKRSTLNIEELRRFFKVADHASLLFESDSFEKVCSRYFSVP